MYVSPCVVVLGFRCGLVISNEENLTVTFHQILPPQEIHIGFSTTDALLSRAIRAIRREPVSHAWILHRAYGGMCVMESEWRGFRVVDFDFFRSENRICDVVQVTERMKKLGLDPQERVDAMRKELGDKYDVRSLFGFVIPGLVRGQSPRQLFCAEACVRFAPQLFPGADPERTSPWELHKLLTA